MKIKDLVKRSIASNIRRARLDANMTQAEAAEKLGITAQAISNFERGVNNIESSILHRMCEIYNVSIASITGDDEENPDQLALTGIEEEMIKLFRQFPGVEQKLLVIMMQNLYSVPADTRGPALETLQAFWKTIQKP